MESHWMPRRQTSVDKLIVRHVSFSVVDVDVVDWFCVLLKVVVVVVVVVEVVDTVCLRSFANELRAIDDNDEDDSFDDKEGEL